MFLLLRLSIFFHHHLPVCVLGDSLNAKPSETLNQVALPVVPYDTCKRMDYWWFQVKPSMICCGYTLPDELKSVCQVKEDKSNNIAFVFFPPSHYVTDVLK